MFQMANLYGNVYLTPASPMERPLPHEPRDSDITYDDIEAPDYQEAGEHAYTHLHSNRQPATQGTEQKLVEMEAERMTTGPQKMWQRMKKFVIFCSAIVVLLFAIIGTVFIGLYFSKSSGK